jgi:hypothetical protein
MAVKENASSVASTGVPLSMAVLLSSVVKVVLDPQPTRSKRAESHAGVAMRQSLPHTRTSGSGVLDDRAASRDRTPASRRRRGLPL